MRTTLRWAPATVLAHLLLLHSLAAVSATGRPSFHADEVGLGSLSHSEDEDPLEDTAVSFDDDTVPLDGATKPRFYMGEHQQQQPQQQQTGVLGRLLGATRVAVAPIKEYYDLVARFHKWRVEYNRLQAEFGSRPDGTPKVRDWHDVMRLEYANVDKQLVEERCASVRGQPKGKEQQQNMDFIWKVLAVLIGRLETELEELRRGGPAVAEQCQAYAQETHERLEKIEASVKEATDRAKGIVGRAAAGVAKRELSFIVELLISNKLASYVAHAEHTAEDGHLTLMGRLEPFVLLLGHVDTPLIVSYLRSIRYRALVDLAGYYLSAVTCSLTEEARPQAQIVHRKSEGLRELLR